jgi:hypothetical protein
VLAQCISPRLERFVFCFVVVISVGSMQGKKKKKAVVVDVLKGEVVSTITPTDPFFVQYINFYVGKQSGLFGKPYMRFEIDVSFQFNLCAAAKICV